MSPTRAESGGEDLLGQIDAARREVDLLAQEIQWHPEADTGRRAVIGFSNAVEELTVAAEEILAQNEQIKGTHALLEDSIRSTRELLDMLPLAHLVTTVDGGIVDANRAARDLLGRDSVMPGRAVQSLIAEDERRSFRAQLSRLAHGDGINDWEWQIWPRIRPPFPASIQLAPIRGPDSTVGSLRWLIRDVSSEAAERARRRAFDAQFAEALVAAQAGSWEWDLLSHRVTWSPQFRALVGAPSAVATYQAIVDAVHPDDRGSFRRHVASRDADSFRIPHRIVRQDDGRVVDVVTRGALSRDQAGRPLRVWATTNEVGEAAHADEALARAAEHGISRLPEIQAELEEFAYAVGHDLQEPLRTITGAGLLLERWIAGGSDDDLSREEATTLARAIGAGGQRLNRTVKELLDHVRVGRAIAMETVLLGNVVASVVTDLRELLKDSSAELEIAELPTAWGAPSQIQRVLQNLISNACKFRRPGQPARIAIHATPHEGSVEIVVSDQGIGVAAEHRDRVFGLFQRLHSQEEYSGSGIGLATCRKIVERHGGRIWIEPRDVGEGVAVHVVLPVPPRGDAAECERGS